MRTIVMIHGMFGQSWVWDNYRDYFSSAGYHCIAPTLRYHDIEPDASPDPRLGTTSLLDYAQDLEAEINQLEEKPLLLGHSMGGLLAQILAARGVASAAVLLTPASPAGIMAMKPSVIKTFGSAMKRWGFWRKPMLIPFKAASYSVLNNLPQKEQKEKYAKFVYESGRAGFEIGFWLLDRNQASRVDETKVECPLLVIAGKLDKMTPHSVVKKVAEKYRKRATFLLKEEMSHWVVEEKGWEILAGEILEWMREQEKNGLTLYQS